VLGTAVRLVIVAVIAVVASFHSVPQARAQDSDSPQGMEIDGVGAYEVNDLMQAWGTPMFESSNPVNLSYVPGGDASGRTQLALGQVDYAISGTPLTDDDTKALAANNVTLIQAPLAAVGAVMVYEAPTDLGLVFSSGDPDSLDGPVITHYSGDIRLEPKVLARMWANEGSYRPYFDPDLVADLGIPPGAPPDSVFQAPGGVALQPVGRSDAGAANYNLEGFIQQYAADLYNQHLTEDHLATGIRSESWPFLDMATRAGPKSSGDALALQLAPLGGTNATGGALGLLDPTTAKKYVDDQATANKGLNLGSGDRARLSILPLLNGAGEWVAPSPDSITAAMQAGGGVPMYGLNENAPGAYPFTWVDSLFVPSTGLSVDKTNAIATFLRYATGPGQSLAAGVQDGQLPTTLVADAAKKADQIVKGNCDAAGGKTRTDPTGGPDWPTGVAPPSGGALICVAPADDTATTQATGAQSNGGSSNQSSGSGSSSGLGSGSGSGSTSGSGSSSKAGTVPAITEDETGGSGGTGPSDSSGPADGDASGGTGDTAGGFAPGVQTVRVDLPLGPPDDGQFALDRFSTILLGGVVFVVLRSLIRPRLARPT
jgi:hypothetical protein